MILLYHRKFLSSKIRRYWVFSVILALSAICGQKLMFSFIYIRNGNSDYLQLMNTFDSTAKKFCVKKFLPNFLGILQTMYLLFACFSSVCVETSVTTGWSIIFPSISSVMYSSSSAILRYAKLANLEFDKHTQKTFDLENNLENFVCKRNFKGRIRKRIICFSHNFSSEID